MADIVVRRREDLIDPDDARAQIERYRNEGNVEALQELHARARAGAVYLAHQRGKLDDLETAQLGVVEAAIRVERAIGAWIAVNITAGNPQLSTATTVVTLPTGVSRDDSSKWQRLATITDEDFDAAIETQRAKGTLTRAALLRLAPVRVKAEASAAKFNQVNDNIGWAKWSWNPVTGCLHTCEYCYARDIAERFYPQGFKPTFLPERLVAPQNTQIPGSANDDPAWRRVFTCSMADLFGKWVPQEWIDAVFEQIVAAPEWEFLCLTKFPQRLAQLDWPDNTWVGTTVDKQHRVDLAQRHFADVKAGVKWLSCEPLLEPVKFESLEMFDWVVIGACTASSGAPEFAPPFDWVIDLYQQARDAGCKVYLKHNLFGARAGAEPGMAPVREWPR